MKGNRRPRAMLAAWGLVGALALILVWPASKAMASVPLEEGVTKLAGQIVSNSQSKNLKSIAIVPFVNTDGSYSELSNFLVDELVLKLFTVPGNTMRLIERQQLGAMLAEMSLGWADIVSTESTQHLGKVHGVQGLVIGSITDMSDSLRITARLIETETGGVFSAAAINVAKSPTVQSLLSRRITLAGPAGASGRSGAAGGIGMVAAPLSGAGGTQFTNEFMRASVSTVLLDESRKEIGISLLIENLGESEFRLKTWQAKQWTVLVDAAGVTLPWIRNHGIDDCDTSDWGSISRLSSGYRCQSRNTYTPIPPQGFAVISMVFQGVSSKVGQARLSVRFLLVNEEDLGDITVSVAEIPLVPGG